MSITDPPNDICLYNTTTNTGNISESGYVVPKEIGEEWKENNCRVCVCEDNNDSGPEIKCMTIMCPDIKNHPDISDFIMEEVLLKDDCCPSLERVACKEGDQIYDVNLLFYYILSFFFIDFHRISNNSYSKLDFRFSIDINYVYYNMFN